MQQPFGQSIDLTPREHLLLELAAEGLTTREIARKLSLAEKTVEHHFSDKDPARGLYSKLGVRNRAQAIAWYRDTRLTYDLLRRNSHDTLQKICQARLNGQSVLAGQWAATLFAELRLEIDAKYWLSTSQVSELRQMLALALWEQLVVYCETLMPEHIGAATREVVHILRAIGQAGQDQTILGLADYALGTAHYIEGRYAESVKVLEGALPAISNPDRRLVMLRTTALDWAYLGEKQRFITTANQARALIEQQTYSDPQFVCLALGGLGRGQGLLKLAAAFDTLGEGWQLYNTIKAKNKRLQLRYIQLARSELEVMRLLDTPDRQLLNIHSREALRLAQEYDYPRYIRQIRQHLAGLASAS